MELTEMKNERLGERYFSVQHSSGLKILIYAKEGFRSSYELIGTEFG